MNYSYIFSPRYFIGCNKLQSSSTLNVTSSKLLSSKMFFIIIINSKYLIVHVIYVLFLTKKSYNGWSRELYISCGRNTCNFIKESGHWSSVIVYKLVSLWLGCLSSTIAVCHTRRKQKFFLSDIVGYQQMKNKYNKKRRYWFSFILFFFLLSNTFSIVTL